MEADISAVFVSSEVSIVKPEADTGCLKPERRDAMTEKMPEGKVEITGGIWSVPSVSQQPSLQLVRWSVRQTERGSRFLVGYNVSDQEGRVSTAIQCFDVSTARVTTHSGRTYELVGPPGRDADAEWVWQNVASPDLKWTDVSEELEAALQEYLSTNKADID